MGEDVFSNLKKFGLTEYEIKAYKALLLKGPMTPMEAVSVSGIPQPRIYDVFKKLMDGGLVEVSPGKRRVYRAKDVEVALGKKIQELNTDLKNISMEIVKSANVNQSKEPYLWLIQLEDKIREEIKEIINSSKDELIISIRMETLRSVKKQLMDAISRGITVALVVFPDLDEKILTDLKGAFIKKRASFASEVVISDRNSALIRIDNKDYGQNYAIFVDVDNIIHITSYYFYHTMWAPSHFVLGDTSKSPISFRTSWLACDVMKMYIGADIFPRLKILGNVKGKVVNLSGKLVKVDIEPGLRHSFYIETRGKIHSVGGKTARLEEITMQRVEIC